MNQILSHYKLERQSDSIVIYSEKVNGNVWSIYVLRDPLYIPIGISIGNFK